MRDYGAVQRGLLGVFIEDISSRQAEALGLSAAEGILITRVSPGSGAEDAGLREGDVIVAIQGAKTRTMAEMQEQVGRFRPGNKLKVDYVRDGKKRSASVVLKSKSNDVAPVAARDASLLRELGFELRSLTPEEQMRLSINGIKVISIYRDTQVEKTNMEPGFIITKANGKNVQQVEQLAKIISGVQKGKVVLEGVYEEYEDKYFYSFEVK